MATTIDERVLMIALIVALVVFGILNVVEAQKDVPSTTQLQSYSILWIVLAASLMLLALYFWSTSLPFFRCMNMSMRETLGEPFIQPVSATEIRVNPDVIVTSSPGQGQPSGQPTGGKSVKKGLAHLYAKP